MKTYSGIKFLASAIAVVTHGKADNTAWCAHGDLDYHKLGSLFGGRFCNDVVVEVKDEGIVFITDTPTLDFAVAKAAVYDFSIDEATMVPDTATVFHRIDSSGPALTAELNGADIAAALEFATDNVMGVLSIADIEAFVAGYKTAGAETVDTHIDPAMIADVAAHVTKDRHAA